MPLNPSTRLGAYEVLSLLGSGGMGEVYRARDTRLNRDVALKVLPEAFASDVSRLARFDREAQLLASLNHPNIAAIYGFEQGALVLELVDGPTLADRIAGRPIPLDDALPIARQIAQALEAAHEQGVIHRDLKPANIKVRPDGTVKVLDFGLAKALDTEPAAAAVSHSPTITSPAMTRAGMILGTAAYMSPEQARGREADQRSDMWSFGCVLFEMLTGERAFAGNDVAETLAAVIKGEPGWAALASDTPIAIRRLLRRCLAKSPADRLRDASSARFEIEDVENGIPLVERQVDAVEPPRRSAWIPITAVLLTAAVAAALWMWRSVPESREVRLEITTPPSSDQTSLAISPDGRNLVFEATQGGQSQLWLRPLDSEVSRPMKGTTGARYPFWSPESRSVGFFADQKLKRIDVDTGTIQTLANASSGGGTWSDDGFIYFVDNPNSPIVKVSADGGEPVALPDFQQALAFPRHLPGGRLLFFSLGGAAGRGVFASETGGAQPRKLFDADSAALYVRSGHVLFVRQGTLFAQAFDPGTLSLKDRPSPLADRILSGSQLSGFTASDVGIVAFRKGVEGATQSGRLAWFDRTGRETAKIADQIGASNPSISPDGRQLAVQRTIEGNVDIWLLDIARGALTRFTTQPAVDVNPFWSPDGSRILFSSSRGGAVDLYEKSIDNPSGPEERVIRSGPSQVRSAMDWSVDGRYLLYRVTDRSSGFDLWALPLRGGPPFPVVQTPFEDREGQFSPDGKWIAYQSNEGGRFEVYIQPFPGPGQKKQLSTNGGAQVRWRPDGKEIFYLGLDGRLIAVPIQWSTDGQVVLGTPVALFTPQIGAPVPSIDRQQYIVSPDGQRFLMNVRIEESNSMPITVIVNWKPKP